MNKKHRKNKVQKVTSLHLANSVGGHLIGDDALVTGVCTLSNPIAGSVGYVGTPDKIDDPEKLASKVLWIVPTELRGLMTGPHIIVEKPRRAFMQAMQLLYATPLEGHISNTSIIDESAYVSPTARIGEFCVIGPGCTIGSRTELRHHVVLKEDVIIGQDCLIKSHAVIGEEGFGFERNEDGNNARILHVGGVEIGNNVEIGAGSSICSGTVEPTRIGDHTKIDDLVFIAHNCQIGANCMIIACSEISGSVQLESDVWVGPNSTILNGVVLGQRSLVGLGSVVIRDCDATGVYVGSPAKRLRDRKEEE